MDDLITLLKKLQTKTAQTLLDHLEKGEIDDKILESARKFLADHKELLRENPDDEFEGLLGDMEQKLPFAAAQEGDDEELQGVAG